MKHLRIISFALLLTGFSLLGNTASAQKTPLVINPILNRTYNYELEMVYKDLISKYGPLGTTEMLLHFDYTVTFINADFDYYFQIVGLKGYSKVNSSDEYFNTYETTHINKKNSKLYQLVGKRFLVSHEGKISMPDSADKFWEELIDEEMLHKFVDFNQTAIPTPKSAKKIKQGMIWESADSMLVRKSRYIPFSYKHKVKEVSRKSIHVTSTGKGLFSGKEIEAGQNIILNKKDGMLLMANQYLQLDGKMELYTKIKQQGVNSPTLLEEIDYFSMIRNDNYYKYLMKSMYKESSDRNDTLPEFPPMPHYTDLQLNTIIDAYTDSLHFAKHEGYDLSIYYKGSIDFDKDFITSPMRGVYVKSKSVRGITKEGDTISYQPILKRYIGSYDTYSNIGPFQKSPYTRDAELTQCLVDLDIFIATGTHKTRLSAGDKIKDNFEIKSTDSTLTLKYYPRNQYFYTPIPMYSLKCYNAKGEELHYRPTIPFQSDLTTQNHVFTAAELAELYANLELKDLNVTQSVLIEVKDLDHIILEVFDNVRQFERSIVITH
ncbi:hypothetical protein GCM10011506_04920 [Marivirga lumbricoides]|uniref:DUF3857 domain-containing protein n=1 Tax=Marivirga lumbricoides TaxID=1046115 RepID=A0ABQ1LBP1_9BACT|nr:hypothetical protein GCM10011506_04920 [Marivirga lumbricoides]